MVAFQNNGQARHQVLMSHEFAALFPAMADAEYLALKDDIEKHGPREPIWLHEGLIIDGRHRYRACRELGLPIQTREWDGEGSLVSFIWSLNFHRRHLTPGQVALLGAKMLPMLREEAKTRQLAGLKKGKDFPVVAHGPRRGETQKTAIEKEFPVPANLPERGMESRDIAAELTGASPRSIQDAKMILDQAPDLAKEVAKGKMTLHAAKQSAWRRTSHEPISKPGQKSKAAEMDDDDNPLSKKAVLGGQGKKETARRYTSEGNQSVRYREESQVPAWEKEPGQADEPVDKLCALCRQITVLCSGQETDIRSGLGSLSSAGLSDLTEAHDWLEELLGKKRFPHN